MSEEQIFRTWEKIAGTTLAMVITPEDETFSYFKDGFCTVGAQNEEIGKHRQMLFWELSVTILFLLVLKPNN